MGIHQPDLGHHSSDRHWLVNVERRSERMMRPGRYRHQQDCSGDAESTEDVALHIDLLGRCDPKT
jgi:hypothetical protein